MANSALLADEDFRADCASSALPELELRRCYGCRELWSVADLSGGFCRNCADPIKEDDDQKTLTEKAKVPRSHEAGRVQSLAGLTPNDDPSIQPGLFEVKA